MFSRPMFAAGSGPVVNPLPGETISAYNTVSALAELWLKLNGEAWKTVNTTESFLHYWHTAGGNPALYVRFVLVSGHTPNRGGVGTWQQLNFNRFVGHMTSSGSGTRSSVIRVEIATDSSGTNIIATSSPDYTITATTP